MDKFGLTGSLTLWSLLLLLSASLTIGLFIFYVYKRTYGGAQYSRQYNLSHIFVILVTAFLIRVVSSSIYLALGMVGALSIVRFRMAVKDAIEVVFMLWAIVAGIMVAAGGNFIIYALLCSVFIGAMLLILKSVRTKDRYSYMLIIRHELSCAVEVSYALKKLPRTRT